MNNLIPLIISLASESGHHAELDLIAGLSAFAIAMVLVVVNGYFVAAEFAFLGSRASKMEELANNGNRTAAKVLTKLEDTQKQNDFLAACQLGITVVTLALSMYAEPKIADNIIVPLLTESGLASEAVAHTIALILVLSVLTFLHVVVGEMIPKSLALSTPNKLVLGLAKPMSILEKILYLPIKVLNGIGNLLLKLLRVPPEHGHARLYSTEEIEQIVTESSEGGLLTKDSEELISNIFDFKGVQVAQVMTPRRKVDGISVDISDEELIQLMATSVHSRFPVYNGDMDHVIGLLHLKDFLKAYRMNQPFHLATMMRPIPTVPEDFMVEDLLKRLKLQRQHMALVMDEFGGVAGVVTLEDLVEEIVGEVRDEFDIEKEPFVNIGEGVYEANGRYALTDLQQTIFIGEEETIPSVDTVGGFVTSHLGRPPKIGDTITLENGVHFQVLTIDGRAIKRIRVSYPVIDRQIEPEE